MPSDKEERLKTYYSDDRVIGLLFNATQHRETVFMNSERDFSCIRLKVFMTEEILKQNITNDFFINGDYKVFVSLAKYNYVPSKRQWQTREELRHWWFANNYKYAYEYDLLLDFDGENSKILIRDVLFMKRYLEYYHIPYLAYPSSTNGVHIVIRGECFNYEKLFRSRGQLGFNDYIGFVCKRIKEYYKFDTLDTSGVGNISKIRKCEFSINDRIVCFPYSSFGRKFSIELKNPKLFCLRNVFHKVSTESYFNIGYSPYKGEIQQFLTDINATYADWQTALYAKEEII